ncbi:hypothetical protein ABC347_03720 [Sphingomonas sp. 1P06PA]|uniref:hypothetical protein n=1 Tax=Sphingomonas sp. 1P06PA TaxID=554121 RepID=UPI0039A53C3E
MILLCALMAAAAPAGPKLGPIRLQLYYKASGTLSADVAPPAKMSFWNTGAGEGDVKEPAEDLLVSVPIQMPPGRDIGANSDLPLTISVRTRAGKLLATRTFEFVAIPYSEPVWSPLWVNDIQCAGPIVATASWGAQRQSAAISLDCGE